MNERVAAAVAPSVSLADLVALTKPRLLTLVMVTAAGGMLFAPGSPSAQVAIGLLIGTALLVASANSLNMYLERYVDAHMERTRTRPLPTGRMEPAVAVIFGVALAFMSVAFLTVVVSPLVAMLGVVAHLSYVLVYTPLKQRTSAAVWVGAVPGAMPPLMGWVAATGRVETAGLALFALMFLWQVPHFHAIALVRSDEYRRAGLKTLPGERGPRVAVRAILCVLVLQIAVSLALAPLGLAGTRYLLTASILGALYLGVALGGIARWRDRRWARQLFFASIIYLPLLFGVLVMDAAV